MDPSPNTSSAHSSSENPIPWLQYLPHGQKHKPPKLKPQPRGWQAWSVTWYGDKMLGLTQHQPFLPYHLHPKAGGLCGLIRGTPCVTHRASQHPSSTSSTQTRLMQESSLLSHLTKPLMLPPKLLSASKSIRTAILFWLFWLGFFSPLSWNLGSFKLLPALSIWCFMTL